PDEALQLGKSISKTKAEITEEDRQLQETHERLVTKKETNDDEHVDKLIRRRPTSVGSKSESDKSDKNDVKEGEIEWLSTHHEEKDDKDDDDDQSIDIEETNKEGTELENDDQEMIDAKKAVARMLEEEKAPLLDVLVLVIPPQITLTPTLTTQLPTPPILSKAPTITTIILDPLPAVLQRLSGLERKIKTWTKVDHPKAIEASVQANLINKVKNQLPKLLPKLVSDLVNLRTESLVHDVVKK
nr:hypothetical protein [Tanacetum cinerariifolium]